jgi:hypothetical protein
VTLDRTRVVRLSREAVPRLQSRCLFRWRGRDASLAARTIGGYLTGTLSRAVGATALDSLGATYTCPAGVARHEVRLVTDPLQRAAVPVCGIRYGPDDAHTFSPVVQAPGPFTFAVDAINLGGLAIADGGVIALSPDAGTGARIVIDSTGSHFRATLDNGSDSRVVTLSGTAPAVGERFRLAMQAERVLPTSLRIRLLLSIGGSTGIVAQTAWSSAIAEPSAWAAGSVYRINRAHATSPRGHWFIRDAWRIPAVVSLEQLAEWT